MNIGITYDLREDYLREGYSLEETAEFDRPDTIDAIDAALKTLGHTTVRIGHIRHLVARLADGEQWDLVFNIAEGMYGYSREAQIPMLLEAYQIPCTFADPLVLSMALHKVMTKRLIRDHGLATPEFAVVYSPKDIDEISLPFPLFAKPMAEGTSKGITAKSKILSFNQLREVCTQLLEQYQQPVLVETFLSGREFTVGIVGTGDCAKVLGSLEVILLEHAEQEVYSYENKERCEELVEYRLVSDTAAIEAQRLALAAWRALECRDGGRVDIRFGADGRASFIEANPLAGLHPTHSDLPILCTKIGISYVDLIRMIVESAALRCIKKGTGPKKDPVNAKSHA